MPRVVGLIAVLMAWVAVAPRAESQTRSVRFQNHSTATVRTRFDVRGSVLTVGLTGEADSSQSEYVAFVDETRRVTSIVGGEAVTESFFDSSRARHRSASDSPWRVLRTPPGPVGPTYYRRDALLGWSTMDDGESSAVQTINGITGRPEFSLPDSVLQYGQRWSGLIELPYTVRLPDDSSTVLTTRLNGRGTFVLDSIVPRSTDTLAYLQVNAGLSPVRSDQAFVQGDAERTVTVWGTVTASLVWSTGWAAWVTGVTSLRMQHRIEPGPDSTNETTVLANLVSRFSVRP